MADRRLSLKRLLGLARTERPRLAAATFFLAIGSAAGLLFPQAIKQIIDGALTQRDRSLVDHAALLMLGLAALQGAAMGLRAFLFSTAGEAIVARVREQLYSAILSQEIGFFDERRTGELTNRLSSDTAVLQSAVSANISMGLRNLAQVVGGLCFLFYTSPVLTGLMLSVVPAIAIGAVIYGRSIRALAKKVQDVLAESNEVAEESIAGIRTVRSFDAERSEQVRYGAAIRRSFELARTRARSGGLFMTFASFAGFGAVALVFWYGGRLVADGRMTVGGLSSFLVYTLTVAFALGGLADLWAEFMKALGAAERVFELIDRAPQIPPGSAPAPQDPPRPQGEVRYQGVVFAYPSRTDVTVLKGLDLELRAGEVVALVGPSGGGKTTIAGLLQRLYDPREGSVLLDGRDLRALDPGWLRRQIGTVAQEPVLFSSSVADNIRYGKPGASDAEVEAAARAAHAHEFVTRFPQGYGTLVGERGIQLSGGQKQRVAIARAVLKDPAILILDEATSALDAESEGLVRDALEKLMRGRTTLIIAHRLSTVLGADRVVVIDGGTVAETGTHAELLVRNGIYRRLVEKQFAAA
jgi:ABC transporter fused permease/ATP-binding protein